MDNFFGSNRKPENEGEHWLSVSDLMSGLMMVFLFIAIVFMRSAVLQREEAVKQSEVAIKERDESQKQKNKIKQIAITYQKNKVSIYHSLRKEFQADLARWDAEISKDDLSFNFKSPEVLFDAGKTDLKPQFTLTLADFFPRYMNIVQNYRGSIEEVRIEGHTDSKWGDASRDDAYFYNMDLSQGRTRSVLRYIYHLNTLNVSQKGWIKQHIAAVGYSSSKPVIINRQENREQSRRVSFRIINQSEVEILRILGE